MLQQFDLAEEIDIKDLSADLGFDDRYFKYWTCITADFLNPRLELCGGELVVVLILFVVLRLARGFL